MAVQELEMTALGRHSWTGLDTGSQGAPCINRTLPSKNSPNMHWGISTF